MKKVRGKALALVLSLALVVSSFSTAFTSAASRTLSGDLSFDKETDEFYFVNGDNNAKKEFDGFGTALGNPTLKTPNHEEAGDVKIADISHKSGDHLVKWYDHSDADDEDAVDDSDIEDVGLKLRNASSSGEEVLSVLYTGTWTDDDDKEYTVKASNDVTVRVYDKGQVVIGNEDTENGDQGELDDDFAQKTVSHEIEDDNPTDSKNLQALRADDDGTDSGSDLEVKWDKLKTIGENKTNKSTVEKYLDDDDTTNTDNYEYVLKSNSDNIQLGEGGDITSRDWGTASGIKQDTKEAGGNTYASTVGTVADTAPAVTASTDGKTLTVKAAASDAETGWTYCYKKDADKAANTDSALTFTGTPATATIDVATQYSDATETGKIAVTAFDADKKEQGTTLVTVKVTAGAPAVVAADCPTFAQSDDDNATFTLTPATNDPAVAQTPDPTNAWTYKYQIGDGTETAITGTTFTLGDAPADDVTLKVNAYDKEGNFKGSASGTVAVTTATDTPATDYVVASVKDNAGASSLTLSAEPTDYAKNLQIDGSGKFSGDNDFDADTAEDYLSSDSTVKQKVKIAKTIKVDDPRFTKLGKDGSTYLYTGSSVDDADKKTAAVKANGYEIKFDNGTFANGAQVTVDDKASVEKISGTVLKVTVDGDASVDEIATNDKINPEVNVSEGKVGAINFDDDAKGKVTTDSYESEVGNIDNADEVTVNNGKVGNIDAEESVDISGDDDEHAVTVGDVSTKTLTIDSEDSQGIKTGTLKATDDSSEFTLTGDAVTIGGIDFDYYGVELKLDDFQGEIPAPKNATDDDATLSTNNEDDRVTVKGDADISSVSVYEDSQIAFDGALNVANVDGTGKLAIAPGKLYVSSDASDVQLVLNGSFKAGDVAYTSAHDSIDEDSFDNYGFTVTKTEGSDKDTFKVASLEFTGLTIAPATADIAKGYSQTFTASAYAPGSAIPEGYSIKFAFDGNDEYFTAVDNGDGTATVTVKDLDPTFASENKAVLTAHLEDADGATNDDYDEGEADIKAVAVPATNFKSDTTGNVPLKVGQTYQFKITSLDGKAPTFGVAGNGATVQYAGATGNDYFYKVTGAKEGSYGVYVNGGGVEHRAAILVIKGVNVTTDTTAVTKAPGQTYQFKITAPSQPSFGAVGLKSVLAGKSGNNYFYKVTASNVKGGHGIYVNGVRVAIFTVA